MVADKVDQRDIRLATEYETLRRREYELITDLLEVLPGVDNLPDEQLAQMRDALFHADNPYLMVFVGPFSSGKSSIINALMGKSDLMPVGVTPTTDHISILRWGEEPDRITSGTEVESVFYPSPLLQKVSFVDTPGLESVFQKHEETTRNFLHRADVVFLVMLATQAMTARNLEYLQRLKEYGTKVIILINQIDLLTPEEAATVHEYVLTEAKSQLGTEPDVWLISARKGLQAQRDGVLDEGLWHESGLDKIVSYVDQQLSDVDRMRQKLRTPLQITQNVTQAALAVLRQNQAALDHFQNIADNIEQQLAAQKREQERAIQEIADEVSQQFGTAAMNGSEAIRDSFAFSRVLGLLWRGLFELLGLSDVLKRGRGGITLTQQIFERHRAFEPIRELPAIVDRLGPRLEGKDIQDIDDLVKYAQREIKALPPAIREKVIGEVRAPLQYDRRPLQEMRPQLEAIEDEARNVEIDRLDRILRNTTLYLVVYEILVLLAGLFISQVFVQVESLPVLIILVLGLALLGLVMIPLRGRMVEAAYTNRMLALQKRYIETLTDAANKQLAYSLQLRRGAVAPLTRLVEAQTTIQREQLQKLQESERELASIESALTSLGKKNIL
ncbi:MAG TPA: dynamin family protein, partial [Spirillospora sp.]|nr:dynamin family protein [Spirillospora sp.]